MTSTSFDYIMQFKDAIAGAGLIPPAEIVGDGGLRRFAGNGKHRGCAEWYVLHTNGVPAGAFGSWRTNVQQTWRADIGRELSGSERAQQRALLKSAASERDAEESRRHALAATAADKLWQSAKPAPPDHPYLVRKSIKPNELRIFHGDRVIRDVSCDGALLVR